MIDRSCKDGRRPAYGSKSASRLFVRGVVGVDSDAAANDRFFCSPDVEIVEGGPLLTNELSPDPRTKLSASSA